MKTIKTLLLVLLVSFLASCSTDSIDEDGQLIDPVSIDFTITTSNGQTVDKSFIETKWVLTERTVLSSVVSSMPCGEYEVATKIQLNVDGSVYKYGRSIIDCTEYRTDGTYVIVGTTLRIDLGSSFINYTINDLTESSMRLSNTSSQGVTTSMSFTDVEQGTYDDEIFFIGDWVLVDVMVDYIPQNINDFKCGNRFESLTFNSYQNATPTNDINGTCSIFKKNDACPNSTDEVNIPYKFRAYQADTDGYQFNDQKFTIYTSTETLELTTNEFSFEDESSEWVADTMNISYNNDQGLEVRLNYERPY